MTIYRLQPKLHVMGVSIGVLKANPELDVKIIFSKNHNILFMLLLSKNNKYTSYIIRDLSSLSATYVSKI